MAGARAWSVRLAQRGREGSMTLANHRADTVVALMARQIHDGAVVATGVVSPLAVLAIAVARATHAPNLTYLACVGSMDPELSRLYPASEDLRYLEGRRAEVSIADLFDHARRGRIDTVFFGGAEVDGSGRTNMSLVGSLDRPKIKFPGIAGASSLRRWVKRPILLIPRQSKRSLVPKVQFASTQDVERSTTLITDLGVFQLGPHAPLLTGRHAWATDDDFVERTAFQYQTAPDVTVTAPPDDQTLRAIYQIDVDGLRHALVG